MSFASETKVPVERTQAEIRKTLERYKASAFAFAESIDRAQVQFEMNQRRIKFIFNKPVYMKWKKKN